MHCSTDIILYYIEILSLKDLSSEKHFAIFPGLVYTLAAYFFNVAAAEEKFAVDMFFEELENQTSTIIFDCLSMA